jgi:hypothetical protein
MMAPELWMSLSYLAISIALTVWVARTLFRNGQVFLDDALGDGRLAASVNRLLVVGFYLLNMGYVTVAIRVSAHAANTVDAVQTLSVKVGMVLLVLGLVHFFNLYILSRFRRRRLMDVAPPPIPPTRHLPAHPQTV